MTERIGNGYLLLGNSHYASTHYLTDISAAAQGKACDGRPEIERSASIQFSGDTLRRELGEHIVEKAATAM